jgi:RHS repeat-associated protein
MAAAFVFASLVYEGPGWSSECSTILLNELERPSLEYATYSYNTGASVLTAQTQTLDGVSKSISTNYNDLLLPILVSEDRSKPNESLNNITIYPTHSSYSNDAIAQEMIARNMVALPLEKLQNEVKNAQTHTFYHSKQSYGLFAGNNAQSYSQNLLPNEVWVASTGSILEKRIVFNQYDLFGRLREYLVDDIPNTILWGYGHQQILAQIKNANYTEVAAALNALGITPAAYSLNRLTLPQRNTINDLRNMLPNALVEWSSHKPHIGVSQQISTNGLKTDYFYDDYARLKTITDHEDQKLFDYEYLIGAINRNTTIQYRTPTAGPVIQSEISLPNNITTHIYYDGLGREKQIIGKGQTPKTKDLVLSNKNYDAYGMLISETLPFPTPFISGDQVNEGLAMAISFYKDGSPFKTFEYEASPLRRLNQQIDEGETFHALQKAKTKIYEAAGANIRNYSLSSDGSILLDGFYPANSLFKNQFINEQGNGTVEIIDKQGRIIQREEGNDTLKLISHYIYDAANRLVAAIQPETYLLNTPIPRNAQAWTNGIFYTVYDERGRPIEKYLPNSGKNSFIYDKADRLVMNQSALQAETNHWTFFKYDGLGREIINGEISSNTSAATLRSQFYSHNSLSEIYSDSSPATHYYSNTSFPFAIDSSAAMQIKYYDRYGAWRSSSYLPFGTHFPNNQGLLTGVYLRYDEDRTWLPEVHYYDSRARVIETRKKYFGSFSPERLTYFYNFMDQVSSRTHVYLLQNGSFYYAESFLHNDPINRLTRNSLFIALPQANIESQTTYTYDEVGRLITKKYQPNRQYERMLNLEEYIQRPPVLSTPNTFDLATKAIELNPGFEADAQNTQTYLADIDSTQTGPYADALQQLNYDYHIRGMLKCLNCRNGQSYPDLTQNDLFAFKLGFEGSSSHFDGNISSQTWHNPKIVLPQTYLHSYDPTQRLTRSLYSGGGTNYSLDTMRYDANGNIIQLKRPLIDDLSYAYTGNRLLSVSDATSSSQGFSDGNLTADDYGYWPNGALKFDKNKGIDSIIYSGYLDKVKRVKFADGSWQNYYYNTSGTLLKRLHSSGEKWVYREDLIERNDEIYQINHQDGRVIYDSTAARWLTEFHIKDHLGHLRVVLRDSLAAPVNGVYKPPMVVQAQDFDPWGREFNSFLSQKPNNFTFGGYEKNEKTLTFDAEFRNYDALIGRWWQSDAMAELAPQLSPYRYGFNNPVNVTDPDGNFEYTDGYGTYSSFAATGAIEFSGAYGGENGDCPQKPCGGGGADPTPWYLKWLEPILIGNHIIGDAVNKANGRFDTSPEENVLAGTNYLIENAVMFQTMSSIFGGKAKTKIPLKNGNVEAGKTSTNAFKHSFKYADRVRMRAVQDPVSHNFPYSFDDAILSTSPILKNNGYKIFQQAGTMNGKNGVFEIGLTKGGIIDHRFFRPIK